MFQNVEAMARQYKTRCGSLGVWIEDKSSGIVLIQQALRRNQASFMCPTIKKGHSCKAAHADVITAREPASPKTLAELGTSSLQMSEWRKLAGASISNFLGGFFQTRTLQRDRCGPFL